MRLEDKIAIVTEGRGGIGKAISLSFACEGTAVRNAARIQSAIVAGKADTKISPMIKEDKSKMLRVKDHISACAFPASDDSKYSTGWVLPIEWFG